MLPQPPWFWTAWSFALAGYATLVAVPEAVVVGFGHIALPAQVHLFTLGAVLTGYYGIWLARAYDGMGTAARATGISCGVPRSISRSIPRSIPKLPRLSQLPRAAWTAWAAWVFQTLGTGLMVWGLWWLDGEVAYLGGHHLVPTGIALVLGVSLWRTLREVRTPRRSAGSWPPWRLIPQLGLLVLMGLGVMLLLDRFMDPSMARYGVYTPGTVALHALAGMFLFLLPAQNDARETPADLRVRSAVVFRAAVGALGLLVLALSTRGVEPGLVLGLALGAVPDAGGAGGAGLGLPVGLGLLAMLALWEGIPAPPALMGLLQRGEGYRERWNELLGQLTRLPWAVGGLLLGWLALRYWRGADPGETYALAGWTATAFILGAAVPHTLWRVAALAAGGGSRSEAAGLRWVVTAWGAAGLIGTGQVIASSEAVRAGAVVGLMGLGLLAQPLMRR